MVQKPTWIKDVDDVLVKHVDGFVAWNNLQEWADKKPMTFDDYTENWEELWGVSSDETELRKQKFFIPEIIGAFEVIEGAALVIPRLAAVKSLYAVTARRESLKPITEKTLEAIAPGAFSEVVCTTYFEDGQKYKRDKADICVEKDAEGITDDQIKTCNNVAAIGRQALLFGDYPWQSQVEVALHNNVVPVKDWQAVAEYFNV